MKQKKIGLIEEDIKVVRQDDELAEKIVKARGWKKDKLPYVQSALRYNMFTVQQFSDLSGRKVSTINNMTRFLVYDEKGNPRTELDYCNPFSSISTDGPKMIYRNHKSISMLLNAKQEK